MIRVTSLALFAAAVVGLAGQSVQAQLPVAPPPREVRPDGTRDAAPTAAPAKAEDPAVVVDRIIKNSKDVGDKLSKTDTGTNTRKTQSQILTDIDALINRQENPPPPKPDNNQDKDKNKDKDNNPMKQDMPPMGGNMPMDKMGMGMGQPNGMPMGGMGMNDQQPMGGMNNQQPMGGSGNRRQRMGEPKNDNKQPDQPENKNEQKNDKQTKKQPKEGKSSPGASGGGNNGKVAAKPSLPFDEDVAKDVWGHLPPKLRQQMTQYYKEDVMPKYSELLRLYYSSLSDKNATPMFPRK